MGPEPEFPTPSAESPYTTKYPMKAPISAHRRDEHSASPVSLSQDSIRSTPSRTKSPTFGTDSEGGCKTDRPKSQLPRVTSENSVGDVTVLESSRGVFEMLSRGNKMETAHERKQRKQPTSIQALGRQCAELRKKLYGQERKDATMSGVLQRDDSGDDVIMAGGARKDKGKTLSGARLQDEDDNCVYEDKVGRKHNARAVLHEGSEDDNGHTR